MLLKKILTAAAAVAVLGTASVATAADRDRDGRPDNSWAERHDHDGFRDGRHDRYWKPGFRGYIGHDRVYWSLRQHNYSRWIGDPYFYHGRYVIRTYNRFGRVVFVELNPYTGGFIGEIRF